MIGGKSFKPKEKTKSYLPLPATFNHINNFKNRGLNVWLTLIVIGLLWFNPLGISINIFQKDSYNHYPQPHPFTSPHTITTNSKYIFPPVEDAPLLKELGRGKLVKESRVRDANHPEIDVSNIMSLNSFDNIDPTVQMAKERDENAALDLSRAKNSFKNHDKIVYKPKNKNNYPDVIIVTAIDFEKYSLGGLTNIVQNRIDYAHAHNYGVYVRWYQEFLPWVNSFANFDNFEKRKWIRTFCLRSAMFAFPDAKWFWYFDEDGLIMDLSINLQDYVLKDESLSPIMLREQPINPQNGIIKTYKSTKPSAIRLIVTQSDEKIETDSFIIKNDVAGKSILEFWNCDLFFEYPNFPYGPDSALTHILQWHPYLLSKTAIILARTIAAKHSVEPVKEGDHLKYVKGDFTVSWSGCKKEQCESTLSYYNSVLHPPNDQQ